MPTHPSPAAVALHAAYVSAVSRARKIASREHHLLTTFALHDEIDQILAQSSHSLSAGDITTANALRIVAARLTALISPCSAAAPPHQKSTPTSLATSPPRPPGYSPPATSRPPTPHRC